MRTLLIECMKTMDLTREWIRETSPSGLLLATVQSNYAKLICLIQSLHR
jgi:hypothetical protein